VSQLRVNAVLTADGAQFHRTMSGAERAVQNLGRRFAAIFSVGMVTRFAYSTMQWASKLTDLAARTGIAVEELQRMEHAAKQAGVELDGMVRTYQMLEAKRFAALRGERNTMASFAGFGISQQDLKNKSAKELFDAISRFVAEAKNPEALIGPLRDVLGRQAPDYIEAFSIYTGKSMENLAVMSTDTANAIDEVSDALAILGQDMKVFAANAIGWIAKQRDKGAAFAIAAWEALKNPNISPAELYAAIRAAQAEEIAQRRTERTGPKFDIESFVAPQSAAKEKMAKLYSDSLVGVGNFLGAGKVNAIDKISQQQLDVQRKMLFQLTAMRIAIDANPVFPL
jgi:DNA-binding Xre family transcriptional regulator